MYFAYYHCYQSTHNYFNNGCTLLTTTVTNPPTITSTTNVLCLLPLLPFHPQLLQQRMYFAYYHCYLSTHNYSNNGCTLFTTYHCYHSTHNYFNNECTLLTTTVTNPPTITSTTNVLCLLPLLPLLSIHPQLLHQRVYFAHYHFYHSTQNYFTNGSSLLTTTFTIPPTITSTTDAHCLLPLLPFHPQLLQQRVYFAYYHFYHSTHNYFNNGCTLLTTTFTIPPTITSTTGALCLLPLLPFHPQLLHQRVHFAYYHFYQSTHNYFTNGCTLLTTTFTNPPTITSSTGALCLLPLLPIHPQLLHQRVPFAYYHFYQSTHNYFNNGCTLLTTIFTDLPTITSPT